MNKAELFLSLKRGGKKHKNPDHSAVAWIIGITDEKPSRIAYGLGMRPKMPDIDIDFAPNRRQEVIDYVIEKYGKENVIQIAAFGHMRYKAAFNRIAKAHGLTQPEIMRLSKEFGNDEDDEDFLPREIKKKYPAIIPQLERLQGVKQSISAHAAGIVITSPGQNLRKWVPEMYIASSKRFVAQFDLHTIEEMGLMKQDFLGLRNLMTIDECLKMIKANKGLDLDPDSWIPDEEEHDDEIYQMLSEGKVDGVFQLEGRAVRAGVVAVGIDKFMDIAAVTALYRKPSIDAGFPKIYIKNKKANKTDYIHPDLAPILEDTWGVTIYQEQVMQIAKTFAGFTDAEVDDIISAVRFKDFDMMDKIHDPFINGCLNNGIKQKVAEEIWQTNVRPTASYLFNKSHSVGYCVDEETEILTKEGWKSYEQLKKGDEVFSLNTETGLSEWDTCLKVNIFPEAKREMLYIENNSHSSLTTLNHRWFTERYKQRQREWIPTWTTSEKLSAFDAIPIAAPCDSLPDVPKFNDELVEAVAWYWTEGHDISTSSAVSIYQANPAGQKRIEKALRKLFGSPIKGGFSYLPALNFGLGSRSGDPAWRKADRRYKATEYRLNASAGKVFRELAPNRVPSMEFLRSLTQSQLELFIKVSMMADNNGKQKLSQKSKNRAEAFQIACILSGKAAMLYQTPPTASCPCPMWTVSIYTKTSVMPKSAASQYKRRPLQTSSRKIKDKHYTIVKSRGKVWCPTTNNQTWLARRNGKVFFTGNSLTSYATARLKFLYPHEYMTALIRTVDTSQAQGKEKRKRYLQEAVEMGLTLLPPDINLSEDKAIPLPEENAIMFGLADIKGIGVKQAKKLIEGRNPLYIHIKGVYKVCNNMGVMKALKKSGALEKLGKSPRSPNQQEEVMGWNFVDTMAPIRARFKHKFVPPDEDMDFVALIGEITDIAHGKTKNNKPYLTWTIRWSPTELFKVRLWSGTQDWWELEKGQIVKVRGRWDRAYNSLSISDTDSIKVLESD